MKIRLTNLASTLNRISNVQLVLLCFIGSIYFFLKQHTIFSAFLISAIASFSYTQLIKISTYNKIFALYGFPIRLILIAPLAAILVHKFHSNLLALFIGLFLSQAIYFIFIWSYAKRA